MFCFVLQIQKNKSERDLVKKNSSSARIEVYRDAIRVQQSHPAMLFENPAVAAKLPFPYNIPPPMQAAAGVPQIR